METGTDFEDMEMTMDSGSLNCLIVCVCLRVVIRFPMHKFGRHLGLLFKIS